MTAIRNIALVALAAAWLAGCTAEPGPAKGPWTRAAPMPTARSEIAAAALGGRIYVAGGIAQFGTTDAFEAYDPATDTWTALAPLPVGLHHTAMAALDGRLYLAGGYDSLGFNIDRKAAWAYTPKTGRWHRIADMPAPRAAHKLAALGGRLYAVGGVTKGGAADAAAVWSYDPATNAWKTTHAPPALRHRRALAWARQPANGRGLRPRRGPLDPPRAPPRRPRRPHRGDRANPHPCRRRRGRRHLLGLRRALVLQPGNRPLDRSAPTGNAAPRPGLRGCGRAVVRGGRRDELGMADGAYADGGERGVWAGVRVARPAGIGRVSP
jgi:hypothetical protein